MSTHFSTPPLPSRRSGKRSGHSQMPEIEPAGAETPQRLPSFRLCEEVKRTLCSGGHETLITQLFVGSCHITFGSRKSFAPISSTGLPANFVQVRPLSLL